MSKYNRGFLTHFCQILCNHTSSIKITFSLNYKAKIGKACVITLSDDRKVFACSTLYKRLESVDIISFHLAYVRPLGKTESKSTGNMYWNFDLVIPSCDELD